MGRWLLISCIVVVGSFARSDKIGQGAPGWSSPSFLQRALVDAAESAVADQYAPPIGASSLIEHLKEYYYPDSDSQWDSTPRAALVTNGASQAISLACTTFLREGDEAIILTPGFDMYAGSIILSGATPVFVALLMSDGGDSNDTVLDFEELKKAVTSRTKMLILNSPQNPIGKVFTAAELRRIDDLLPPSCLVLSDEVYEHLTFDAEHIPFSSVSPTAARRTLSVYSSGKSLSATGLKVGWMVGPSSLISHALQIQQYVVFSVSHIPQVAIAASLRHAHASGYFSELRASYRRKRDLLVRLLSAAGFDPIIPRGAFFICARVPSTHPLRADVKDEREMPAKLKRLVKDGKIVIDPSTEHRIDYNVCRRLTIHYGVAAIPLSAFGKPPTPDEEEENGGCIVRFAFCHPDDILEEAGKRLLQKPSLSDDSE